MCKENKRDEVIRLYTKKYSPYNIHLKLHMKTSEVNHYIEQHLAAKNRRKVLNG